MKTQTTHRRGGFTLVEIMIVVAIIALLAAIAVPSFLRARKRSQGTATLETCRMIDAAKDQYAIENGKSAGITPSGTDLCVYVKKGTKLYNDLWAGTGNKGVDALGRAIETNGIDVAPTVATQTKTDLADALNNDADTFFGAYK
jgi:prepilin-type N-terminal cleavage/methylation domain-containing protein